MSRSKLAEDIKRLLPSESDKRIRQAIMLAYGGAAGVARTIRYEAEQETRLRTGILVFGEFEITSDISAVMSGWAWVIDFASQQVSSQTLTILPPDEVFARIDYFHGDAAGIIHYTPGILDSNGNSIFPNILEGNVILKKVLRNIDGTSEEQPVPDPNQVLYPPADNQTYGMRNREWVPFIPFSSSWNDLTDKPNANIFAALDASLVDLPSSINRYVTVNLLNSFSYVQEAPINGAWHARRNGVWSAFTPFSGAYADLSDKPTLFSPSGTPNEGNVVTWVSGVPTWAAPSGGGGGNFVAWDVAQSLTATQRQQARNNIGSSASSPQFFTLSGGDGGNGIIVRTSNNFVFTENSNIRNYNGFTAGVDGEILTVTNRRAFGVTLNANANTVEPQSFSNFILDRSFSLRPNQTIQLRYDGILQGWSLLTDSPAISFPSDIFATYTFRDSSGNETLSINPVIINRETATGTIIFRTSASPNTGFDTPTPLCLIQHNFGGGGTRTVLRVVGDDLTLFAIRKDGASIFGQFAPIHPRSNTAERSVRRDELYLNYTQSIATTGTINDLTTTAGVKLISLTAATDLTGIVPVDTTQGRMIRIYASGGDRIIRHENTESAAANRFSIGADITIPNGQFMEFIYIASRWRRRMP